jgi:DNA-binding XRE family transcriptional regulator
MKPIERASSRHAREAVVFLGRLIRQHRIDSSLTAAMLAERVGVSRGLIQRIEKGDPGCSIGAVFEAATLVGVRLFELDPTQLAATSTMLDRSLTLLPRVTPARGPLKDDF